MDRLKIALLFVFSLLIFVSCKKATSEDLPCSCGLHTGSSSDTNYIPHKKGNYWIYCNEATTKCWNGWSGKITFDTVVGSKIFFERTFDFQAGQSGGGAGSSLIGDDSFSSMIDNLGNYYFLNYRNNNFANPRDTILIIKPSAINGDTIYNNVLANVKVVLVDKNETFRTVTGCYHSRVIINASSANRKIVDHYYKKGIGEIYFTENIEKVEGEVLSYAKIN